MVVAKKKKFDLVMFKYKFFCLQNMLKKPHSTQSTLDSVSTLESANLKCYAIIPNTRESYQANF